MTRKSGIRVKSGIGVQNEQNCGIIRGMRKSTKSAIAITLAIAGAIASPFSSNAAALDSRGGGREFSAKRRNRRVRAA